LPDIESALTLSRNLMMSRSPARIFNTPSPVTAPRTYPLVRKVGIQGALSLLVMK